jgi:hypothetical protein
VLASAGRQHHRCSDNGGNALSVYPGWRRGSKGHPMDPGLDLPLQRVFDRVELVSGAGDPEAGELCVMSLVACLAGERHTDHPVCASPLIRAFAIPVNDHMPREVRQRLKPFAPRILGTNDGRDGERAEILRHALAEESFLQFAANWQASSGAPGVGLSRRLWMQLRRRELHHRVERLLGKVRAGGGSGDRIALASAAAQLLALYARDARDAGQTERCWSTAIGLLDRFCDVGASRRQVPGPMAGRLTSLGAR